MRWNRDCFSRLTVPIDLNITLASINKVYLKESRMRKLLKVLNPVIAFWNFFKYSAHLEGQRHCKVYEPYNFAQDTAYF